LERGAFVVSVERAAGVVRERENFFFRDAEFAADRSVDVLSKLAPVERGDAAIDEGLQFSIDQPRRFDAAPHGAHAAKDRRAARVEPVIQKRRAPPLRLRCEHAFDVAFDRPSVRVFNSSHINLNDE